MNEVNPTYLNPIAELDHPDSEIFIEPTEAYKIRDNENFFCPDPDCTDPKRVLIASKSTRGNYFFKHKAKADDHKVYPQTLLHRLAVKWFDGKKRFEIPSCEVAGKLVHKQYININTTKTELEYRKFERIVPDVKLITTEGFEFAIEIVVSNDISEKKAKHIDQFNLPTLRINLKDFYYQNQDKCRIDHAFIIAALEDLLTDIKLKTWAIRIQEEELNKSLESSTIEKKENESNLWKIAIPIAAIVYCLNRITKVFRRTRKIHRKKKKRRR